ncbi:ethanolamine ammonia-lyase reactivating factor EutA [Finegoldia magna]|uniref:Ethanolamine ammonia-lyase reactivating factor EutA n=1 Tax=Finegoldia magna TaxID=1260 RepID=A0A7D4J8S7_FINMA|nr:ethanolamine ammonia-lyase reactivating factor EutA [Finegoldia magna]EGS34462.1 ethanolamine utilization protein EutA-like protein [Finegoldia magna SY403409CC001050417]EXF27518.1 exopolyphosphatase [Finegoldia magna ALB8]MBS6927728.1 ethanolamine ammonia-lyase reactivating factor EutA [Finegoldia magna]MDU1213788.1 ethanolamine ammonia-lyase reactivating factor EutA [Finegoldia magna]MDU5186597.1 ethanolamine ammonia-lyase reactivating factor EutA [Finegoldia magna]
MIYAVIDIGSNTIRLSVYKVIGDEVKNLFNEKSSASLASFIEKGMMNEHGIQKLINTLKEFKNLISNFEDISKTYAIATASIRNSCNRREIIERVRTEVGIDIELISGEEEAKLSFLGSGIDSQSGILTDIGGGSSEIVVFEQGKVVKTSSLNIGSLVAFDNFARGLFITKDEKKLLEDDIKLMIASNNLNRVQHDLVCAVGGSARACLKLYNEYYDKEAGNVIITMDGLKNLINTLINMENRAKMKLILKVKADRIHTLIPGMIILYRIAKYFYADIIRVSMTGIREGFVYNKILERG